MYMTSGTAWGHLARFSGVSSMMLMMSSMKPSVRVERDVGMVTAVFSAFPNGIVAGSSIGVGVDGWAGLRSVYYPCPK